MKTISIKTIGFLFFLSLFSLLSCSEGRDETLVLIPEGKKITIKALPAGNTTILRAKGTFFKIYSDFKHYGLDNEQVASKETTVSVYKLKQKAETLSEVFNSLGRDLNEIYLTQSQVIDFCQNNPQLLCQNGPTLYLIKENNEFFVIKMYSDNNGLQVSVDRLDDKDALFSVSNYHLVIPVI